MRYSNKELDEYRAAIATQGNVTQQFPTCKACKGIPIEELKCTVCNRIKGLDRFAKAQRRNPDHAVGESDISFKLPHSRLYRNAMIANKK